MPKTASNIPTGLGPYIWSALYFLLVHQLFDFTDTVGTVTCGLAEVTFNDYMGNTSGVTRLLHDPRYKHSQLIPQLCFCICSSLLLGVHFS